MVLFPNCKINLGLNILGKRPDGYHDLRTIFYPLPLTDALEIVSDPQSNETHIRLSGTRLDINPDENICLKAWELLKKDFSQLPHVAIHLHKKIPSGAGLGGGSADAAFTLLLLNKKYNLELSQQQLISYAIQLGSDCPFFIINRPSLGEGRGERLQEISLDLSPFSIVIVNPAIHINTAWAFGKAKPNSNRIPLNEVIQKPVEEWKDLLVNDFEPPVFGSYPEIASIKQMMYNSGALYASMSGSGSTVFGIFEKTVNPSLALPSHYYTRTF